MEEDEIGPPALPPKLNSIPSNLLSLSLNPTPQHLLPYLSSHSTLSSQQKIDLFSTVYINAASSGQSDTLEWLTAWPTSSSASTPTSSSTAAAAAAATIHRQLADTIPRKWVDLERTDEEGSPALVLCVALGHAEGVRTLVEAGVHINAVDKSGWTALHWAVRNNDIPIASYLLNHRASPSVTSHRGLLPKDLVKKEREGAAMRDVLKSAAEAAAERDRAEEETLRRKERERAGEADLMSFSNEPPFISRPSSALSSSVHSHDSIEAAELAAQELIEVERQKRLEMAQESARVLDVDLKALGLNERSPHLRNHGIDDDDDDDGIAIPFEWDRCLPDQMLVFSDEDLPVLLDVVITHYKPVRTRSQRVVPANVLFLCARYAHYFGNKEMLADLFIGAFSRIEKAIIAKPNDMTNCAFWLSSCLLLLYYLRTEPNLYLATPEFQESLSDLINEIVVYIIRDVERRLDKILEPAMIEYEALPGFEDVQFEGDWKGSRFVKSLAERGRKSVSVMSIFGTPAPAPSFPTSATIFDYNSTTPIPPIPSSSSKHPLPMFAPPAPPKLKSDLSPRSVISLLSSTLFILQVYEIPPSIIVQAFSQLYYWISCEVFNRMLSQRKYLYRSKAIQVRLNTTSLHDWARENQMPSKMVPLHFAPLNQLLQWLQCLSSESTIDGMIGTIQSLRSLNPLQLQRAVKEYRYEVAETRMAVVCSTYLVQIQEQWESRLAVDRKKLEGYVHERERTGESLVSLSESEVNVQLAVAKMIDESFSSPKSFGQYCPPGGEEVKGEMLNSRYMLPFAVPSAPEMLLSFHTRDAFGPFAAASHHHLHYSGTATPHSTTSLPLTTHSRQSLDTTLPADSLLSSSLTTTDEGGAVSTYSESIVVVDPRFVPILPEGFFTLLDEAKSRRASRRAVAAAAAAAALVPPVPVRPSDRRNHSAATTTTVRRDDEEEPTTPTIRSILAASHIRNGSDVMNVDLSGESPGDIGVSGENFWRSSPRNRQSENEGAGATMLRVGAMV